MIRILLGVLALLVAALAYAMEQPLLYGGSGVLAAALVIGWGVVARQRRKEKLRSPVPNLRAPETPKEELTALGILQIRQRGEELEPGPRIADPHGRTEPATDIPAASKTAPRPGDVPPGQGTQTQDLGAGTRRLAASVSEFIPHDAEKEARHLSSSMPDPRASSILGPLLEGFRTALGAHALGLARRYKDSCEFRLLATAGEHWAKSPGEVFRSGSSPLVRDTLSVSVRTVDQADLPRRALSYSLTPASIHQVAVASESDPPLLLFADTTSMDGLAHARVPVLMAQFVRTLGLLLREVESAREEARPRREIISEEMARTRARGHDLAMAIVYLNRAETIAATSGADKEEAEALMAYSLDNASKSTRIVQFGPLTYGVFIYGGMEEVEAWDRRVHNIFAREQGLLEGGISVGIAILQAHHETAENFRDEAKHALLEAYTSGIPSVLARTELPK